MDQPLSQPSEPTRTVPVGSELPPSKPFPKWLLVLLLGLVFGGGAVFAWKQLRPRQYQTGLVIPSPEMVVETPEDLTAGWENFVSAKFGLAFAYPPEAQLTVHEDQANEQFKLVFIGSKQRQTGRIQTEIVDGYQVNISVDRAKPLDQAAREAYDNSRQNCPQAEISPLSQATVNGYPARSFSVANCRGDYTQTFIGQGNLTVAVVELYQGDAAGKTRYRQTTGQILSTFTLTESSYTVTQTELDRGWYWGSEDQKKPNTPASWVFTQAGRSSCWHAPGTDCIN